MKAKLMKVLDIKTPEKELFGVKITGFRRPLYVCNSDEPGFFASDDKKEAMKLVTLTNKWIKIKGQPLIDKLNEHKDIMGIRIDVDEAASSNSN